MQGDLHLHTTFSDGSVPAEKIPFLAAAAGLGWAAITDHDSVNSVRFAQRNPTVHGVQLIPAVELSAYDFKRRNRVHILCYWPDDCEALHRHARRMADRRRDCILPSCAQLEQLFPQFRTEDALEYAKDVDCNGLYKDHVMRALWQVGLSDGLYRETYRSLFGPGGKVHRPMEYDSVEQVLQTVKACRGVAVLAHPSVYHSMELAAELFAAGMVDGVEIEHPRNKPEDQAELRRLAERYDLIVTGGTDFHGMNTETPHPVGTCTTEESQIFRIRELARARKQ